MNKYNLDILNNSEKICLIAHINPDVDALASLSVFKNFLCYKLKIKNVDVFAEYDVLPENYAPLLMDLNLNPKIKKYDTAIMLDSPKSDRLGKFKALFDGAKKKLVIDHHKTNEFCGQTNIIEYVSSTCEILYSLLKQYKYNFTSQDCENIYAGIITDTNNLTVGEVSSATYKIIAEIYKKIDARSIYLQYFSNNSMMSMKILAKAIEKLRIYEGGKIIFASLNKSDISGMEINANDFNGVVNWLSTIANNRFVCFIYPMGLEQISYHVSMRCQKGFDVSQIAKQNGGGGHAGAAAFDASAKPSDIQFKLLAEFKSQLKKEQQ